STVFSSYYLLFSLCSYLYLCYFFCLFYFFFFFFFFQAEDGIRDGHVTGVQTCALPICFTATALVLLTGVRRGTGRCVAGRSSTEIGRASCREKSVDLGGRRIIKKKKNKNKE